MSTTAGIVFSTVPSLTTCSQVIIRWTYTGTTPTISTYPLVITNIGIDQGGLSRREYLLVSKRSPTAINMTLSQITPSMQGFTWSDVNVPQGSYRMDIYTPTQVLSSNIFNVTNGANVSCLVASSQSSIPPSSTPSVNPTSTPSSSTSSTSNPSVASPTLVSKNSSVNKGVILGGAIGGMVVLALIAVVALWVFRRRKPIARDATPPGSVPRTKGPPKAHHSSSDSTGAILSLGGGSQENSPQTSTSEEYFDSEKFTTTFDDIRLNPPPIAATRPYPKSLTPNRRPLSMTVKPSFESHETVQSRSSRQPRRSLDSSVVPQNKVIPPSPSTPSHPRYPTDRTRRTSRKPVPVYDPTEFPGSEANDTSLSSGKKTYYFIPDAPLEQRK